MTSTNIIISLATLYCHHSPNDETMAGHVIDVMIKVFLQQKSRNMSEKQQIVRMKKRFSMKINLLNIGNDRMDMAATFLN